MAVNNRVTTTQRWRPRRAAGAASAALVVVAIVSSSHILRGDGDTEDLVQVREGDPGRFAGRYVMDAAGGPGGHVLTALQGPAARGRRAGQERQRGLRAAGQG